MQTKQEIEIELLHPDDVREDGLEILREWADDGSNAVDMLNANTIADGKLERVPEDDGGGFTFDGYTLVPFRHKLPHRRLGGDQMRDATGWIVYAGVTHYSYSDGYDYDEVVVLTCPEGLANTVVNVKVEEYKRNLREGCYQGIHDCRECDGVGYTSILDDSDGARCKACGGTGHSADARAALGKLTLTPSDK